MFGGGVQSIIALINVNVLERLIIIVQRITFRRLGDGKGGVLADAAVNLLWVPLCKVLLDRHVLGNVFVRIEIAKGTHTTNSPVSVRVCMAIVGATKGGLRSLEVVAKRSQGRQYLLLSKEPVHINRADKRCDKRRTGALRFRSRSCAGIDGNIS